MLYFESSARKVSCRLRCINQNVHIVVSTANRRDYEYCSARLVACRNRRRRREFRTSDGANWTRYHVIQVFDDGFDDPLHISTICDRNFSTSASQVLTLHSTDAGIITTKLWNSLETPCTIRLWPSVPFASSSHPSRFLPGPPILVRLGPLRYTGPE